MIYSHIWDGLLKLASLFAIIIAAITYGVEERLGGIAGRDNAKFVLIALAVVIWAILYRQVLSIFASWLYSRVSLGANVTFGEAKALRKLFQLDFSFKWIPLKDVKKLPREQRHDKIMQALSAYGPQRKAMFL